MTVETKPDDLVNGVTRTANDDEIPELLEHETIVGGLGETSGIVEIAQLVGNVVIELVIATPKIKDKETKKDDPDCIR